MSYTIEYGEFHVFHIIDFIFLNIRLVNNNINTVCDVDYYN